MSKISMPDFRTWAENIINMSRQYGTAQDEIERALEQSFNQGIALGRREISQFIGIDHRMKQQCSKEYWGNKDER